MATDAAGLAECFNQLFGEAKSSESVRTGCCCHEALHCTLLLHLSVGFAHRVSRVSRG